jgi:maltooligosyltrehalose trehalohydrolase
MKIGADYLGDGRCEFVVWAPFPKDIIVKLVSHSEQCIPMEKDRMGYWKAVVDNIFPGTLYLYRLEDERDRPDPVSHLQSQGVHGPSEVFNHRSFKWEDNEWAGIPLSEMIMYELHVGTFTPEGTFESILPRLADLNDLGINAVEIMPVAQFPGERNWGYDSVYPFAVQNTYGGPNGLKRLVNECHKIGVAVILDVVYNHFGPEGNYIADFGPFFTEKYKTPWGKSINFDDAYSNEVRNFFIENALHWFENYHIDALRLDAIHGISDMSAYPFLKELAEKVEKLSSLKGRKFYLIAESDLNDSRVIRPRERGGYGIDAQWSDDFHHSIHVLLTGEEYGYYTDFGKIEHLVRSVREGFVYSGQYSQYRKRSHGNSSKDRPAEQFIVFSQNHDQVGNRMLGERLSSLVSFEALKLAAGAVILSPYIPLLFMGEEYGEDVPFIYFVSHLEPDLIEAVQKGRKEELRDFTWKGEPPDPQNIDTFVQSKIYWEKRYKGKHKILLDFYKTLIGLRKKMPPLSNLDKDCLDIYESEKDGIFYLIRWRDDSHVLFIFNFKKEVTELRSSIPAGEWRKIIDSSDNIWNGPGTLLPDIIQTGETIILKGQSFALFFKEGNL